MFASSDADLNIIHRISLALTQTPRLVSPTDFHNSVHNAAAGYWSIAVGARAPSSTISAYDFSFAAGLAEACTLVRSIGCDTLLVAFDLPPPQPLLCETADRLHRGRRARPHARANPAFAGRTAVHPNVRDPTIASSTPALEELRRSNPATAALPLLELLAQRPIRARRAATHADMRTASSNWSRSMLDRAQLSALIPHAGSMCLLDSVRGMDARMDPLLDSSPSRSRESATRSDGALAALHLAEYGAQAMAVHGALLAQGGPQAGMLGALRDMRLHVARIDDLRCAADRDRDTASRAQ